ncbi:MAG: hypothetical protein MI923_28830 [Phycisphaerales bacterium]|nr:hypothetical protein [Phycisphaerales bacterium]
MLGRPNQTGLSRQGFLAVLAGAFALTICHGQALGDGACCTPGDCDVVSAVECFNLQGLFNGDGTTCTEDSCDPFGACCDSSGNCELKTELVCKIVGLTYLGDNVDCPDEGCDPSAGSTTSQCCLSDGTCQELSEEDCMSMSGEPRSQTCDADSGDCRRVPCCLPDNGCNLTSATDCSNRGGRLESACVFCENENADLDLFLAFACGDCGNGSGAMAAMLFAGMMLMRLRFGSQYRRRRT